MHDKRLNSGFDVELWEINAIYYGEENKKENAIPSNANFRNNITNITPVLYGIIWRNKNEVQVKQQR